MCDKLRMHQLNNYSTKESLDYDSVPNCIVRKEAP